MSEIITRFAKEKKIVRTKEDLEIRDMLTQTLCNDGLFADDKATNEKEAGIRQMSFKDIVNTKEFYQLMPEVVENVLVPELEYQPIISNLLFQEVPVPRPTTYVFSQLGALEAGEVAEGGEYPESQLADGRGGFRLEVPVKKYGLRVAVTDEVIDNDLFGVFTMWLRKAGNALVQRREVVCHDAIQGLGRVVFDNKTPANALYGSTTGRGPTGAANGTLALADLMDMYGSLADLGFTPDIIILHPFAWKMWATNPELRESMIYGSLMGGQQRPDPSQASSYWTQLNNPFLQRYNATGNPTLNSPYTDPLGLTMKLGPNPYTEQYGLLGNTFHIMPGVLPSGVALITSPFVTFTKHPSGAYYTDVIMADSKEVGVILRQSRPTTEEWRDPHRDIRNLKIMERYGAAIMNQGKGIAIAKNVSVARTYEFRDFVVTVPSYGEVDQTTGKGPFA